MEYRKDPLINGEVYHIFIRSIAKFVVFNDMEDYIRLIELITLYSRKDFCHKYSNFKKLQLVNQKEVIDSMGEDRLAEIITFCLMPTHVHLLLKQVDRGGITKFMSKVFNSYSRYFNLRHRRKGPLWEGHFKNVLVKNDEQLLHLTRYIHINPSSAGLVKSPFQWPHSSLKEYVSSDTKDNICTFRNIIDMPAEKYRKFILDRVGYQKSLSIIKNLLIDNYSG